MTAFTIGWKESQIAEKLDALTLKIDKPELGISEFIACKVNGAWVIKFTYRGFTHYILHTKYGKVRVFKRINGVEKWMTHMGVSSFTVSLMSAPMK